MKRLFGTMMSSPLLWGGMATVGFYAALRRGLIANELLLRYTAGHPVEYITVTMFFIGMAALLIKGLSILREKRAIALGPIFPPVREKESIARIGDYLKTVEKAQQIRGDSFHVRRLKAVLTSLQLNDNTADLDQELRFLADEDQFRASANYGMIRMFIWAIPILGFLGTVLGITIALGNLNLTELETTGKLLAAGLQVAFDTTALALTLVFFLYFSLYFVQARETIFFQELDRMIDHEVRGRFASASSKEEEQHLTFVRKVLDNIAESFETIMRRQMTTYSGMFDHLTDKTNSLAAEGAKQIEISLVHSLSEQIHQYNTVVQQGQQNFITKTIQPLSDGLERTINQLGSIKDQMIEEGKVLHEVLRVTGEVTCLEDQLNHNLATLAKVGSFEETVNTLAATIHLLNSKLTTFSTHRPEIRLAASPELPRTDISGNFGGYSPATSGPTVFPIQQRTDSDSQ